MAKLSSASIRLVQKLNRKNRFGEFPIYVVVCWHGRLEKACGVSCLPKYWDAKREIIKAQSPNAAVLNKMLSDIKQRVIDKRNEYEFECKPYTCEMLLKGYKGGVESSPIKNSYKSLMDSLIDERRLSANSSNRYMYAYRKLCEYKRHDEFIVDELDLSFVKDFTKWLSTKAGVCDGTIKDILSCVAAVWNYAINKRVTTSDSFPFREFKFTQVYKRGERNYFLDKLHIKMLMDYWLDLVIVRNGNRWTYKDGAYDLLRKRTSKEWGILWFLLCYKLNGSAPIDVVKMKKSECSHMMINGERYYAFDFKRKKTNRDVHVRWKRDLFAIIAIEHYLGSSVGERIWPVITVDDEDKMVKQSNNNCDVATKHVRQAFEEINQMIIQKNVDEDLNLPLVEIDKVVFYSARHSFANHYLNSGGATVSGLASLMARSPNTIATYVHQLTKDEEIASMVDDMVI